MVSYIKTVWQRSYDGNLGAWCLGFGEWGSGEKAGIVLDDGGFFRTFSNTA